jgi:hypothetical protein
MGDFVENFLNSEHGQKAKEALTQQGFSTDEATTYLGHAAQAGADHAHEHAESHGLLGEHAGRNFFAAFAAGIVKGDGFLHSLGDGFEGVIAGRIAEALCNKTVRRLTVERQPVIMMTLLTILILAMRSGP